MGLKPEIIEFPGLPSCILPCSVSNVCQNPVLMLFRLGTTQQTLQINGRGGRIRTGDPLVPNQVRCQTALRPAIFQGSDDRTGNY